jgi:hypothetical protein
MTNVMSPEDHLRARIESQRQEIERLQRQLSDCELSLRNYDDGVSEYWLRHPSHEPCEPQAPIARIRIGLASGYPPQVVKLYSPGLPSGEHDLYCEPMSVAPALKSGVGLESEVLSLGKGADATKADAEPVCRPETLPNV